MYANFYYQRSTKRYGRGPWIPIGDKASWLIDGLEGREDFLHIGMVYDQDLFRDSELKPNTELTP